MRTIPKLSLESKTLYENLSKCEKGQVITYHELNDLINGNVQKQHRGSLYTAIDMARREEKKVFEAVRGIGVKCVTDEENCLATGPQAMKKIRRASTRAMKKITAIDDFDSLPRSAKVSHNMSLSLLGTMRLFTKPKKVKQVERAFESSTLPLGKTLELFK